MCCDARNLSVREMGQVNMLIYVFGGTASGKSKIAEDMACGLKGERIYLATMENVSSASKERIEKHRQMRAGKGFATIEQPSGLSKLNLVKKVILLECMSNLLANTMFEGEVVHEKKASVEKVMMDIQHLQRQNDLIVVGNDIFGEDVFSSGEYVKTTREYIDAMQEIHERLISNCDRFVEVVCGIAIERR